MARIYLGLMAAFFIVPSFVYIADPAGGFAANGAQIAGAAALSDVRVMYGMFPIGIGLFLLAALFGKFSRIAALWLCLLTLGMAALGRLLGLVLDHGDQHFTFMCLALEAPAAILTALVLWNERRRAGTPLPDMQI